MFVEFGRELKLAKSANGGGSGREFAQCAQSAVEYAPHPAHCLLTTHPSLRSRSTPFVGVLRLRIVCENHCHRKHVSRAPATNHKSPRHHHPNRQRPEPLNNLSSAASSPRVSGNSSSSCSWRCKAAFSLAQSFRVRVVPLVPRAHRVRPLSPHPHARQELPFGHSVHHSRRHIRHSERQPHLAEQHAVLQRHQQQQLLSLRPPTDRRPVEYVARERDDCKVGEHRHVSHCIEERQPRADAANRNQQRSLPQSQQLQQVCPHVQRVV
mmetsp:Transcript_48315/g.112960  ORF Transcript_48315/g.112960 Transcript_48315/m.112960 type:complete len:267 (-) Transcript_48315:1253-2053(-)